MMGGALCQPEPPLAPDGARKFLDQVLFNGPLGLIFSGQSIEEGMEMMRKAGGAGYRPPGG